MDTIPLSVLFGALFVLILLSGFFSGSETGMMALNRYRLRHLVNNKIKAAILAQSLLDRPDRLIGLILLGNNLVNFIAASIATIIGIRLLGDLGLAIAPIVLVVVFLIFAEVIPKTVAAVYPEKIAFPASYLLRPLLTVSYPFVWLINNASNGLLNLFGVDISSKDDLLLSREELRTVVHEASSMISSEHQRMLISILDLENVTVDDIMVPRNELVGINLDDSDADIIEQLTNCQHTRLIIYRASLDNIVGILHVRRIPRVFNEKSEFKASDLENISSEPYYVPEGTPLHIQLVNFQNHKRRVGLVVDEYGVIHGMVTLEDILEEIVGEFTTDMQTFNLDIHPEDDGSFIIDGMATIRDINKQLKWQLQSDGPKTLNGLILEHLEDIPETGTSLRIENYTTEIIQTVGNAVKSTRITPQPDNPDSTEQSNDN